ncbi:helix-turn-helix domain-containing protein [Diaphorobacter sp. HDW4A]|uniref:DNA-3-methyladenine glycosylase 2 family protein n=1 Tax=Diaphorobacter sp. HDW4A TaxID=2714924 RepID=UPI001409AF02|nr:Ada metal-binding domain-containing protein [Diaphorobacter sp. HDW4A]QIL80252.1 helix-turn-helix domain-containing protein [Diaphorobacter sp. HDW4A]
MTEIAPTSVTQVEDARYLAVKARDARFDGSFFTGVTSTGIYCRPVCSVRVPRRENCRFFDLAAQAEHAGFRPCLRCRPELAPQALIWSNQDASGILLQQALRMLDAPENWADAEGGAVIDWLASRLGVTDRHVRRIFSTALGISPLQYLQTRRLLAAKQLLTDTTLPITQVALASGFRSVRGFNAAFLQHYSLKPSQLRKDGGESSGGDAVQSHVIRLGWRPPYDVQAMLGFLSTRTIASLEQVEAALPKGLPGMRRTLRMGDGANAAKGWFDVRFDEPSTRLLLVVSDSLLPVLPALIARIRAMFDLDADLGVIDGVLTPFFHAGEGMRVPGAADGFELAVRAVLGQQITVAAARTLAQRLVQNFGEPIATPWPELSRLFPTADALTAASSDELGSLGIVRQRQQAIKAIAAAVAKGKLRLQPGEDPERTMAALRELPGIGDWTAQYIAMRALRWPDAFPAGDVALQSALGIARGASAARDALAASQVWRPWRSYAVIRTWAGLARR